MGPSHSQALLCVTRCGWLQIFSLRWSLWLWSTQLVPIFVSDFTYSDVIARRVHWLDIHFLFYVDYRTTMINKQFHFVWAQKRRRDDPLYSDKSTFDRWKLVQGRQHLHIWLPISAYPIMTRAVSRIFYEKSCREVDNHPTLVTLTRREISVVVQWCSLDSWNYSHHYNNTVQSLSQRDCKVISRCGHWGFGLRS